MCFSIIFSEVCHVRFTPFILDCNTRHHPSRIELEKRISIPCCETPLSWFKSDLAEAGKEIVFTVQAEKLINSLCVSFMNMSVNQECIFSEQVFYRKKNIKIQYSHQCRTRV